MKKPSLSFIILAIVLGALAFYEVKDTITGDKQFFLVRMMFWNPGYAKKIEIKPYLLTDEQVIQSLSHPEIELQQPTNKNFPIILLMLHSGLKMMEELWHGELWLIALTTLIGGKWILS